MKYAVLSDVHGNLEALAAVLEDIRERGIREVLFLGDAVGYGPDPGACIELLHASCAASIAGNHDRAVLGLTDPRRFNDAALQAIVWTRDRLNETHAALLAQYPLALPVLSHDCFLVHGTPHEPDQWHYLMSLHDAGHNFNAFDKKICMVGHTHQPFIIERLPSGELVMYRQEACIGDLERYIMNAGSVGQPRDGDPRACYLEVGDDVARIRRISYDIGKTQRKIVRSGLPESLAIRLALGR